MIEPENNTESFQGDLYSPLLLVAGCQAIADSSERFRKQQTMHVGSNTVHKETETETEYEYGVHALCERDGTTGLVTGRYFELQLNVSQDVEELPHELAQLMERDGEAVPEKEDIQSIIAEYALHVTLLPTGLFGWDESRRYDVWTSKDSENEGGGEDDSTIIVSNREYRRYLGGRAAAALEDKDKAFAELVGDMLVDPSFRSPQESAILAKAFVIYDAYISGGDYRFELSQFFPEDIVQQVERGSW